AGWDIGAFEFISGLRDTNTPVISAITATNINGSAATIGWSTDENANSRVDYGTTTNYGSVVSNATLVLVRQLNLSGLTPATLYHYRVQSSDAAGNTTRSGDYSFQTAALSGSCVPAPAGLVGWWPG